MTTGERAAVNRWYVLRNGHRYELRLSVAGERRVSAVVLPPPHPSHHASQVPVTRQDIIA